MRAKKAKALRSMATRLGAIQNMPAVAYTAAQQHNGKGEVLKNKYAIVLDECVRRTYQTMKKRYKQWEDK